MTYMPLIIGPIMILGGMGLIYLWFALRPIDAQIAASEARTAALQKETAEIEQRTAREFPNYKPL